MRYGRALLAGLGWVGALGGLALCVLIFLSAYLALHGDGPRVKPRGDGVVRLPSVPDAQVPRVPLARPSSRLRGGGGASGGGGGGGGGAGGGAAPAPSATPRATVPVRTPVATAPPRLNPTPAPNPTPTPRPTTSPPPTLGDTTRQIVGAVGTEVGRVSPPVGQVVGDAVDALNPPAR